MHGQQNVKFKKLVYRDVSRSSPLGIIVYSDCFLVCGFRHMVVFLVQR